MNTPENNETIAEILNFPGYLDARADQEPQTLPPAVLADLKLSLQAIILHEAFNLAPLITKQERELRSFVASSTVSNVDPPFADVKRAFPVPYHPDTAIDIEYDGLTQDVGITITYINKGKPLEYRKLNSRDFPAGDNELRIVAERLMLWPFDLSDNTYSHHVFIDNGSGNIPPIEVVNEPTVQEITEMFSSISLNLQTEE